MAPCHAGHVSRVTSHAASTTAASQLCSVCARFCIKPRPLLRCPALIRARVWSFKSAWSGMCRHHDIMTPHTATHWHLILWHHGTSYFDIMTPHTMTSWHLILSVTLTLYTAKPWHHVDTYTHHVIFMSIVRVLTKQIYSSSKKTHIWHLIDKLCESGQ